MRETRSPVEASAKLVELVYELLDAHDDTSRLAQGLGRDDPSLLAQGLGRDDPSRLAQEVGRDLAWAAHLDYLAQLQRVGRELLAARASALEP